MNVHYCACFYVCLENTTAGVDACNSALSKFRVLQAAIQMRFKETRRMTWHYLQTLSVVPQYLSIALFIKEDCVQKCSPIHMEDTVKTVTEVVKNAALKWSHFELCLKETESVCDGLLTCRIVHWLGRGCLLDWGAECVSEMKLYSRQESLSTASSQCGVLHRFV